MTLPNTNVLKFKPGRLRPYKQAPSGFEKPELEAPGLCTIDLSKQRDSHHQLRGAYAWVAQDVFSCAWLRLKAKWDELLHL